MNGMSLLSMSFFPVFGIMAFIAVVLLFEGLYMMWNSYKGPDAKKIKQRLRALSAGSDVSEQASVLKTRMLSQIPAIERCLFAFPRIRMLDRVLLQSGSDWTVAKLLFVSFLSWLGLYMLLEFVNM